MLKFNLADPVEYPASSFLIVILPILFWNFVRIPVFIAIHHIWYRERFSFFPRLDMEALCNPTCRP